MDKGFFLGLEKGYSLVEKDNQLIIEKTAKRRHVVSPSICEIPRGEYEINVLGGFFQGKLSVGLSVFYLSGRDSQGDVHFQGGFRENNSIELLNRKGERIGMFYGGEVFKVPKLK